MGAGASEPMHAEEAAVAASSAWLSLMSYDPAACSESVTEGKLEDAWWVELVNGLELSKVAA